MPTLRRSDRGGGDRILAGGALCGAIALTVTAHHAAWSAVGIFAAFVLVAELLDTELPSGARLSLSLAPALGFALIGSPVIRGVRFSVNDVAIAYAAGTIASVALRAAARQPIRVREASVGFGIVIAAAAAYHGLFGVGPRFGHFDTQASALGLGAVAVIMLFMPPLIEAAEPSDSRRSALIRLGSALKHGAPLQLAIVSVGALVALAYPKLGPWSFPLFVAPLLATQYAFKQFASIRTTYVQTVRGLARVPEMAGYTEPGHSQRVAEIAIKIAAELGASSEEIREVEYGALLHDIGRVVLEDPDEVDTSHRLELALTGASIVEKTGTFPRVARMIREQYEPYRRRGENANRDLELGAKIIRVASAYDDLVRPGQLGYSPWDAIERLHSGMAYDYDPAVIQALTRVLEERGEI